MTKELNDQAKDMREQLYDMQATLVAIASEAGEGPEQRAATISLLSAAKACSLAAEFLEDLAQ